jgi:hypothetical protein
LKFTRAVARLEALRPTDWEKIADYARGIDARARFEREDAPASLKILQPISGSISKGVVEVLIYEMGEAYLWVWVTTSPHNQRILYFTNSTGPQKTKVLWDRNPEYVRSVSPSDRIVTITQWSSLGQSWIVTRDSIVVVHRNQVEGGEDFVRARVPLDADGRLQIQSAIEKIPTASRGKHHNADNVFDGISMEIGFSPDGGEGSDDIALSNAWTDEIRPLLANVSKFGPKEFPIELERFTRINPLHPSYKVTIRSRQAWSDIYEPLPRTSRWNIWRKLAR